MKIKLPDSLIVSTIRDLRMLIPKRYKIKAIITTILVFINTILDLIGLAAIFPLFAVVVTDGFLEQNRWMRSIYDFLGFTSQENFIIGLSIFILLSVSLKNLVSLLIQKFSFRFSFEINEHLSKSMLERALSKGWKYINTSNSNEIHNLIVNIPFHIANYVILGLITVFSEGLMIVILLTALIIYDVQIIAISLLTIVPFFLIFYQVTKKHQRAIGQKISIILSRKNQPVFEMLFGYVDIIMSGRISHFKEDYVKQFTIERGASEQKYILDQMPVKLIDVVVILAILFIFNYGYFWMEDKSALQQLLAVYALATLRLVPSVNKFILGLNTINQGQSSLKLMKQNLEHTSVPQYEPVTAPLPFVSQISIHDVSFDFGEGAPVLSDANATITKGSATGFIGASGSGKSTLFNLILGFLEPTKGEIRIDDQPLTNSITTQWREKIGYVRQEVFLTDKSLLENIALGVERDQIDLSLVEKSIQLSKLTNLVESLPSGLDSSIGEQGAKLSGGQRQRVAIARAIYNGAEVLLFDEATSALDETTERDIIESIKFLKNKGFTILIITHRTTLLEFCDNTYLVENKTLSKKVNKNFMNPNQFTG